MIFFVKIILFFLVFVAVVGLNTDVFGEIFINPEKEFPFSIEYPSNWNITFSKSVINDGVMIDSDETGRNGIWIGLWQDYVDPNLSDTELKWFLKDHISYYCQNSTFEKDFGQCTDLEFQDTTILEIDGFRAVTSIQKYTWEMESTDPRFSDSTKGTFYPIDTLTWIIFDDDIWIVATTNDADKFDKTQTFEIVNSFKIKPENSPLPQTESWFDYIITFFTRLIHG